VGIRASYWLTGGIMTVLGLALARFLSGVLGALALSALGLVLAVGAFLLKAVLVLLVAWLLLRMVRWRRREVGA
jgi:hypothetical protein